jgi:hypothetical protein
MSFLNSIYGVITISVACLSVSSSLLVVLTFIFFNSMRRKLLMKIIAYISLCDCIANVDYIIPYRPMNGTWDCTLQGLLNLTVYPMSWFWTPVLGKTGETAECFPKFVNDFSCSNFLFCTFLIKWCISSPSEHSF